MLSFWEASASAFTAANCRATSCSSVDACSKRAFEVSYCFSKAAIDASVSFNFSKIFSSV